jgi:hypothetical protein
MKNYKEFTEEVFNHHIVQGSTEKGKVTHSGSLRQMQKAIRDPKMPTDHVLVKTRHDLKTGDDWKKHMHAEDATDNLLKKKKKIAQTISHPGYDAESKNEGIFGSTSAKKSRDKLFLAKSRGNTIKKDESVNELSKDLLQRAGQAAKKKAGQQRAVSKVAASRVGDTSQPPGQNIKSKRADYQAAKKDYQAFKFDKAARKKDAKEGVDMYDNKRKEAEMRKKTRETPSSPETQAKLKRARAGEVEEGKFGAVAGAIAGGLAGGPGGAVAGAVGGHLAQNAAHMIAKKLLKKKVDHNRPADAKTNRNPQGLRTEIVKESIKPQSHEYFGSGPFSGDYNDVATSVMRVVEKTAKENPEEEDKGFEKMSNDKLNKSVTNAYLEKVREEV